MNPLTTEQNTPVKLMWAVVNVDAGKICTVHTRKADAVKDLCGKHEKVVRVEVRVV